MCPGVSVLISCGAAKEGGCSDVPPCPGDGADVPREQWFGWGALLHSAHLVHAVPSIPVFPSLHLYSPEDAPSWLQTAQSPLAGHQLHVPACCPPPSPSHTYLHAPQAALPCCPSPLSSPAKLLLKGDRKQLPGFTAAPLAAWERCCLLPLLSGSCASEVSQDSACLLPASCSTMGPASIRLSVHFVCVQYICFTALPAGSPPRLGPLCPRRCPSVGRGDGAGCGHQALRRHHRGMAQTGVCTLRSSSTPSSPHWEEGHVYPKVALSN